MNYNIDELFTDSIGAKAEVIPVLSKEDEKAIFETEIEVPDEAPILPLRGNVLFPGVIMPVNAGRKSSIRLLRQAVKTNEVIGVVTQRNQAELPIRQDLYDIGTFAKVIQILDLPNGGIMAIVQGYTRFTLGVIRKTEPFLTGEIISQLDEHLENFKGVAVRKTISLIRRKYADILKSRDVPSEIAGSLKHIKGDRLVVNFVANHIEAPEEEKQKLLEMSDYVERANKLNELLDGKMFEIDVRKEIEQKTTREMNKQQREFFLRQEIHEIQKELGVGNPNDNDINQLLKRAKSMHWSNEVYEFFLKEVDKLRRIQPQMADYVVQYNYLVLMLELPWGIYTKDKLDLKRARKVLDRDHYGLEKIKERILEHIAVLRLRGNMNAPILCLVGPPGTGKTSLGRSIADAIGRKYVRIALGGLHDESEIRGHRKTYVGSMPGRIIQSLKKAQSSNPVFILDEIDKVQSNSVNGDPTSALLEVLDPEQNKTFHDNYLDIDYDLSKVLFIATANSLSGIQPALLDRMEIIDLSGYIMEEKLEIATRHILPRQIKEHGLDRSVVKLSKSVISKIINDYTREAGVRQLEKQIAKIVRRQAVKYVECRSTSKAITASDLKDLLGLPIHQSERRGKVDRVGVVTGLAWTPVGGEILFIESSTSKGKGGLSMTGNLGDVMKESATLAFEYLKANAARFGVADDQLENLNVHVHVPEGATPKDGPSAGITIFTAMISAFTQRKVRSNFAMTGEITLRGAVTPVGGIKEKILAAKRAEITDIILCQDNRRDVEDVPADYLKGLTFHYINEMAEVLPIVLLDK